MKKHLRFVICVLLLAATAVPASPAAIAAGQPAPLRADFNGDRYADLAIGVPYEDVTTSDPMVDAGSVNVLYGSSPNGLSTGGNQIWAQSYPGVEDDSETQDQFGNAMTAGDFNSDGYMDLAIGVPYEDIGTAPDGGAVNVLYGTEDGLGTDSNQFWSQGAGIDGAIETGDNFGAALAAGDFDGDGYTDLAVGVPFEDYDATHTDSGGVNVIYGSSTGLTGAGDQYWDQETIGGASVTGDQLGASLAAGDFNRDGYSDLAIGVPYHDFGISNIGVVDILYGSASGLTTTGNQMWLQGFYSIPGDPEDGDHFGSCLATADFNGDGYADLAVGVPDDNVAPAIFRAGAVNVLFGSASRLTGTGSQLLTENTLSPGYSETMDRFGTSLAAGDFDRDGFADLAVGIPLKDFPGADSAGAVEIFHGAGIGLHADSTDDILDQDTVNIADDPELNDTFGTSLAAGDFDGDGYADLAIGVPSEDLGSGIVITNAGLVHVLYGSSDGLSGTGSQVWTQDSGIEGFAESNDFFGQSLTAVPNMTYRIRLPQILT
jgi:hypothetical protein